MSLVAISSGVALYLALRSYFLTIEGPPLLRRVNGKHIFDVVLVTISWRLARTLESLFGTRRLQPQLAILACGAIFAGFTPLYMRGIGLDGTRHTAFDMSFALIWAVGIACAAGAAYQAKFHRFAALILLGGTGLITCISFVWLSAPDLALTQLVVEAVTTVLLLLGLRWLPKRLEDSRLPGVTAGSIRWNRARDGIVAVAAGSGMAALAYVVMVRPQPETIADFFVKNAYTRGGGTNIVNVILVDFRAFDTFGEITVLAIVALAVYALLRRFRPAPDSIPVPEQQHTLGRADAPPDTRNGDTVKSAMAIPALMMAMLFPLIGATAIFLLFRGHDLPGGGFVAGITMAAAFILQYMACGTEWVEQYLRVLPMRWMGIGLLMTATVGGAAWFFDTPFLTSSFSYVDIPMIGSVPAASALLFDLGVFALVVGATVLMLIAIAHQSVRSHRVPGSPATPPSKKTRVR
jgi:multicomponent K+:H+ antiporter subunit A